jgi:hypothetical protein
MNDMILSTTQIIAVDSTGLAAGYSLTTKPAIDTYKIEKKKYDDAMARKDYEHAGTYHFPAMFTRKSDVETTQSLFNTYNIAFPGACGLGQYTKIVNITDQDVQKIGRTQNLDVYGLIDKNHTLYKMEYAGKIQIWDTYGADYRPTDIPQYTLEQYVAKNPLLFYKDSWGRFVAIGEYDLTLPGGCGKPVVYLYPEKPTQVQISFTSPMQLTTDVPTYHYGWNVLAKPDGTLKDLQTQYTDCNSIDSTKRGLEYAKTACAANSYPYLYWAGNSIEKTYPTVDKGWIVNRNNLRTFMNTKLDEIGLTAKEKGDMLEYWLPEMLTTYAPYYQISFLQTKEMNEMVPMNFNPIPQSFYRIFLDYRPLTSKPDEKLQPQILQKIQRNGFTAIEWGGLKR